MKLKNIKASYKTVELILSACKSLSSASFLVISSVKLPWFWKIKITYSLSHNQTYFYCSGTKIRSAMIKADINVRIIMLSNSNKILRSITHKHFCAEAIFNCIKRKVHIDWNNWIVAYFDFRESTVLNLTRLT